MLARLEGLKDVNATRDSLHQAAKQLVALLGWTDMNLHTAYDNVERWLGPVEELCLQAGSKDVELLLHLRRIKRVMSQTGHVHLPASMLQGLNLLCCCLEPNHLVCSQHSGKHVEPKLTCKCNLQVLRVSAKLVVKGLAEITASDVVHALTAHTKACKQHLLPSARTEWPNSLDLVVAQLSRKQHEGNPGQAKLLGTALSRHTPAGQLVQEQDRPEEALSLQLRLRARLHLEVLRVLEWCLAVLDSDYN